MPTPSTLTMSMFMYWLIITAEVSDGLGGLGQVERGGVGDQNVAICHTFWRVDGDCQCLVEDASQ